jgi:hypothetical protein
MILKPTNDQRTGQTATLFALQLYQELANSLVINKFMLFLKFLVTFGLVWSFGLGREKFEEVWFGLGRFFWILRLVWFGRKIAVWCISITAK